MCELWSSRKTNSTSSSATTRKSRALFINFWDANLPIRSKSAISVFTRQRKWSPSRAGDTPRDSHLGISAMTSRDAQQTAHSLIQSYIGPDHKVMDMSRFYSALGQALQTAHEQGSNSETLD